VETVDPYKLTTSVTKFYGVDTLYQWPRCPHLGHGSFVVAKRRRPAGHRILCDAPWLAEKLRRPNCRIETQHFCGDHHIAGPDMLLIAPVGFARQE